MAELDVQRKKNSPWWLWLLIALVVLGLIFFFLRSSDDDLKDLDTDPDDIGSVYTPAPSLYAMHAPTIHRYAA